MIARKAPQTKHQERTSLPGEEKLHQTNPIKGTKNFLSRRKATPKLLPKLLSPSPSRALLRLGLALLRPFPAVRTPQTASPHWTVNGRTDLFFSFFIAWAEWGCRHLVQLFRAKKVPVFLLAASSLGAGFWDLFFFCCVWHINRFLNRISFRSKRKETTMFSCFLHFFFAFPGGKKAPAGRFHPGLPRPSWEDTASLAARASAQRRRDLAPGDLLRKISAKEPINFSTYDIIFQRIIWCQLTFFYRFCANILQLIKHPQKHTLFLP